LIEKIHSEWNLKKKNIWSNLIFLFYVFTCSRQSRIAALSNYLWSWIWTPLDIPTSMCHILQLYVLCYNKHPVFNYDQEKIAAVLWCKWNLTKHSVDWNFNTSFLDVFYILFSKVFWFYCPRLSIELMDDVTYNFYKKKWWIHIKLTKNSFKIIKKIII